MIHVFLYSVLFLFSFFGFAADLPEPNMDPFSIQEPLPSAPEENRFLAEFFYMLFMLGLLLSAVIGTSWFLKRLVNSRYEQLNTVSAIKVLEKRALSPKTTLYALDIEGETYLLAETPTSLIQLVTNKKISTL